MRGFMNNLAGTGEDVPNGRIVVLEDTNDDGKMDKSTVFLDSLILPRSVKVLEHGVLVAAPPNLWLVKDTNGDLKADVRELVFGLREIRADGTKILINGREAYLRGTHNGGDFPLTGYPPTDVESWKKIFRTCQAWGLNLMRFH